ncbi:hypothetical protein LS482_15275 [Sinomicrobium kalidii]|uniref:hypothetical protein n=1 Tax=Sinomicrobium kalidii TaxID=2900738 RepID=UPI001E486DB3|nr:hypothetical protein [Sinomicrobium kalidii]UGU15039.1 hypothetical protein LS482_15275 [Sinomicrobium kalidii]
MTLTSLIRHKIRSTLIILLICLSSSPVFAQDLNLQLNGVGEQRYITDKQSRITLQTKVEGLKIDKNHQIQIQKITTAVDNTGYSLRWLTGYPYGGYFQKDDHLPIAFSAPGRQATEIEKIEGVLQYFTISEDKKSKVTIANITERKNENLLKGIHPDIRLIQIDVDSLKKLSDESNKDYDAAVGDLHRKSGIGRSKQDALHIVNYMLWNAKPGHDLVFYVEDKNKELYRLEIYDDKGKKVSTSYSHGREQYRVGCDEPLQPDYTLRIIVKNEDAIEELPFQLKNIKLP